MRRPDGGIFGLMAAAPKGNSSNLGLGPSPADVKRQQEAARRALRADSGYKWLKKNLPDVLSLAPDGPAEFRFISLVACWTGAALDFNGPASKQKGQRTIRPDRRRQTLRNNIGRVRRYLPSSWLPAAKREMLDQLLGELYSEAGRQQRRGVEYIHLLGLAEDLHHLGIPDDDVVRTLVRVASVAPHHETFSQSTARRYLKFAYQTDH